MLSMAEADRTMQAPVKPARVWGWGWIVGAAVAVGLASAVLCWLALAMVNMAWIDHQRTQALWDWANKVQADANARTGVPQGQAQQVGPPQDSAAPKK